MSDDVLFGDTGVCSNCGKVIRKEKRMEHALSCKRGPEAVKPMTHDELKEVNERLQCKPICPKCKKPDSVLVPGLRNPFIFTCTWCAHEFDIRNAPETRDTAEEKTLCGSCGRIEPEGHDCFPAEADPTGRDAHASGAKLDAGKPRVGLVLLGFSKALLEVAKVGTMGAAKYSDNGWMEVPNGQARYTDALLRHLLAARGKDEQSGLLHAAHAAWNALAVLELMLKEGN